MKKIFIIYGLFLMSCATPQYRISSNPTEAEIEVISKNGVGRVIGKTPLSMNSDDINPNKESLILKLKKEGYDITEIFVPESATQKNIEFTASLKKQETGLSDATNQQKKLNEIASMVADIQKEIQTKNYDLAINKIARMMTDYPTVSTFYSLMGNVHYLEKRLDKALSSYKKALELNPNSAELQKIIEKLSGMNGEAR